VEPEHLQPFVIGYFKEEIYDEDGETEESRNMSKSGTSKVMMNPRELFTKDFLMMKHPKIRPDNRVKGDFD
jgi:hypothetical protein